MIEYYIPDTSPEDNSYEYIGQERIDVFFFRESVVLLHKKITNHKSQSVWESIPRRSYMDTIEWDIKNMHMNTRVIQYNWFIVCEVIFFDFC